MLLTELKFQPGILSLVYDNEGIRYVFVVADCAPGTLHVILISF